MEAFTELTKDGADPLKQLLDDEGNGIEASGDELKELLHECLVRKSFKTLEHTKKVLKLFKGVIKKRYDEEEGQK